MVASLNFWDRTTELYIFIVQWIEHAYYTPPLVPQLYSRGCAFELINGDKN